MTSRKRLAVAARSVSPATLLHLAPFFFVALLLGCFFGGGTSTTSGSGSGGGGKFSRTDDDELAPAIPPSHRCYPRSSPPQLSSFAAPMRRRRHSPHRHHHRPLPVPVPVPVVIASSVVLPRFLPGAPEEEEEAPAPPPAVAVMLRRTAAALMADSPTIPRTAAAAKALPPRGVGGQEQ